MHGTFIHTCRAATKLKSHLNTSAWLTQQRGHSEPPKGCHIQTIKLNKSGQTAATDSPLNKAHEVAIPLVVTCSHTVGQRRLLLYAREIAWWESLCSDSVPVLYVQKHSQGARMGQHFGPDTTAQTSAIKEEKRGSC